MIDRQNHRELVRFLHATDPTGSPILSQEKREPLLLKSIRMCDALCDWLVECVVRFCSVVALLVVVGNGEDHEAETLADVVQLANRADSPMIPTHRG